MLDIDPDHEEAKNAIVELSAEWKQDIREKLAANELTAADNRLRESMRVFKDDIELTALEDELTRRTEAESLVATASEELREKGLDDLDAANSAIRDFRRAQELVQDHPVAGTELERIALHMVSLAETSIQAGDTQQAIQWLSAASSAAPELIEVQNLRQQLNEETTTNEALSEKLAQARQYLSDGALVAPSGRNAADTYQQILATQPDHPEATAGLQTVRDELRQQIERLLGERRYADVDDLVGRAASANLSSRFVGTLRERLNAERQRTADIVKLVESARTHLSNGFVTGPEENNAVQDLQQALELDPDNVTAAGLMREAAERLADVAADAWEVGMRTEALDYLQQALALQPENEEWQNLRAEWDASPGGE